MIYSLRFQVTDLGSAESRLNKSSVRTTRVRGELIGTDAEDNPGAPVFFGGGDRA
jgi:hypothetical protein